MAEMKLPPQNIEAEQSLLGCLLIEKDAIVKVADIIMPEDFYKDAHELIFKAMLDLYGKNEPIDIIALSNRLEEKNQLEKIGGKSYLISLANSVATASNVTNYANIVQKKATLRRLISAAADISEFAYEETDDIENVLDRVEQKLFYVSKKYLKQTFTPIKNLLEDAFKRIDSLHANKGALRGIPTGFPDLDNILAGLQKSDLIILAARPSVGKTTLALDIGRQVALNHKIPVGFFSLEMSKDQVVDRLICAEANIDLWKMRTGNLSEKGENNDFTKISESLGHLSEAPIFIDDSANLSVMDIRTKARKLQMEQGLGLIIIDYLQLMESKTRIENRVQEISAITRSLKSIARELSAPVIVISQLSRDVEKRGGQAIPILSDLRESGSIEQDADVVMFIYRKAFDKNAEVLPHEKNIADIHIAKHRNGPTGKVQLYFDDKRVSFRSLEKHLESVEF